MFTRQLRYVYTNIMPCQKCRILTFIKKLHGYNPSCHLYSSTETVGLIPVSAEVCYFPCLGLCIAFIHTLLGSISARRLAIIACSGLAMDAGLQRLSIANLNP